MSETGVLKFLSRDVPGDQVKLAVWMKAARTLGEAAVPVCISILKNKPHHLHYAALLALRQLGVEAWGHGFGSRMFYTVKAKSDTEEQRITPQFQPPEPVPATKWKRATVQVSNRKNGVGSNGNPSSHKKKTDRGRAQLLKTANRRAYKAVA